MVSAIQTITHPRSGTLFSWELLGANFVGVPVGGGTLRPHHTHMVPEDAKGYKLHGSFFLKRQLTSVERETTWYDRLNNGKPTLYILRDGRDVLVSQFHFMKKLRTNFKGFLRGKSYPKSVGVGAEIYPLIQERIRHDPVRAWMQHSTWIEEDWVDTYRFEWIRKNQGDFILQLRDKYGLEMEHKEPQLIKKLVGLRPRKGIEGDWKNHFDEEDLEYYWNIAGERMMELRYERLR